MADDKKPKNWLDIDMDFVEIPVDSCGPPTPEEKEIMKAVLAKIEEVGDFVFDQMGKMRGTHITNCNQASMQEVVFACQEAARDLKERIQEGDHQ